MEVGVSGTIAMPYIGPVRVLGRTAPEVARDIERRLHGLSQSAQVMVSVERGPGQSVVISGDVKTPGREPLTLAGERLLDAVALAGGPSSRAADTRVRLTRGNLTGDVRLDQLRVDSSANVRLAPGDHVELTRDVRSLTVMGAARTVSELAFESDDLSLAEAIARTGGPLDDRADATGVFVFRFESKIVDGQTKEVPVIYRLNLLDPRSYFASQRFHMQRKDVLLIANARSAQFGKLVQLLNTLVSPAITADLLLR
jgi:polysaccharide export outer membrane protein